MPKRLDDSERRLVLLRTSADVAAHALIQLECLAFEWPEYASEASQYRKFVERIVASAKEVGYIEKSKI